MRQLLFLSLLLSVTFSFGQSLSKKQKRDSIAKAEFKMLISLLDLTPKDSIVDIGTGSGYSLLPFANNCPECKFTVQDIDSNSCNPLSLAKQITKTGNKIGIENFSFYYGTEKATNLPSAKFNKILVFDVIHELKYKNEMLNDVKRIMQKNASIYIKEILVYKSEKKGRFCKYPYLTELEFKTILLENKFEIKREIKFFDWGYNRYIKIFECISLP